MATAKATREQIIETADRLFYEQGFTHTSFADVAGATAGDAVRRKEGVTPPLPVLLLGPVPTPLT